MKALRAKVIEALLIASAKLKAYAIDDPKEAKKAYEMFHHHNRETPPTIREFIEHLELLASYIGRTGEEDEEE